MDPAHYCRELETHLCRKNDGHLIRIAGPAFEQVCGWAARGVPLKIAFRGIDRYFERYYARGPRRRPVRIEFCEADVLEAFDAWRRAVGVSASDAESAGGGTAAPPVSPRRPAGLPGHLDRLIARLTMRRPGPLAHPDLDARIGRVVQELDGLRAVARRARGEKRRQLVEHLSALDDELLHAIRDAAGEETRAAVRAEAALELEPFRMRMPEEAFRRSLDACCARLLRDRFALPLVSPE